MATKNFSSEVLLMLFIVQYLDNAKTDSLACRQEDSSLPRDIVRICKVYPGYVKWLSACNKDDKADYTSASSCEVYVGMKVVANCPIGTVDHKIQVIKDGSIKNTSGVLVIPDVQLSDAGEYECRTILENNIIITSFYYNISVTADLAIGVYHELCSTLIYFNALLNCCWIAENPRTFWDETDHLSLYSFGANNVLVRQKWITPISEHYPTDIGLAVTNFNKSTKTFSIKVANFPAFLNTQLMLEVLAIVTITNQSSLSRSLCYPLHIKGNRHLTTISVNTSLPEDMTIEVGCDAIFECHFSSPQPCDEVHVLEYYLFNDTYPTQKFHQSCDYDKDYYIWNETYSLNVSIFQTKAERYYRYKFYIHDVSVNHNNSMLTCSLISNTIIQWQNNASLTVIAPDKISDYPVAAKCSSRSSVSQIAVSLPFILAITTIVIMCGIFYYKRRKKRNSIMSSMKTVETGLNSSIDNLVTTDYSYSELLNQQLTEEECFQGEGFDGENDSEQRRKIDSTKANRRPVILPRRDLSQVKYINIVRDTYERNCMVYISYTEEKSGWVYDYLKPLLESWKCQVILHDEDMIPGYTVSGERQRLILQAHRVILVVSTDYSSSPWCLYELQHAITKEPVLFKGKIIPILVDSCITLPAIIKGIVPLRDSVSNFEQKLKSNICCTG